MRDLISTQWDEIFWGALLQYTPFHYSHITANFLCEIFYYNIIDKNQQSSSTLLVLKKVIKRSVKTF